jgi:plastocyanin
LALIGIALPTNSTLYAAELEVSVVDREGNPVPDVAVYTERPLASRADATAHAVMDQVDSQFEPHLLVIQAGSEVDFPNSDPIAHHVYSFSNPNEFKLPLYKGDQHPPVDFSNTGVVILGCNIHDNMLGYILVVDSPVFGKTATDGRISLNVDKALDNTVSIWSPRIRDNGGSLSQSVTNDERVVFTLREKLRPAHDSKAGGVLWQDY